jgi:hypothetical protein
VLQAGRGVAPRRWKQVERYQDMHTILSCVAYKQTHHPCSVACAMKALQQGRHPHCTRGNCFAQHAAAAAAASAATRVAAATGDVCTFVSALRD